MIRLAHTFSAFAVLMVTFVFTHIVDAPGTVAAFSRASGGQRLLDRQASSSAEETYARLDAMGAAGRDMYLRLVYTVDAVFPFTMLMFLALIAAWAAQRARLRGEFLFILLLFPATAFLADMLENLTVFTLLTHYPARLDVLADVVGDVTRVKKGALMSAFVLPHLVLLATWLQHRLGHARRAPATA